MQVLGIPRSAVRHFVLDNDPVPRALLLLTPSLRALERVSPLTQLQRLQQWAASRLGVQVWLGRVWGSVLRA